ncbi:MAG: glutathione S-transferase, partial [Aquabacterium sp.]
CAARRRGEAWITRQMDKVYGSLRAMSQGLGDRAWCTGNHYTLADITVGCALGYLDFRFPQIDWRRDLNLSRLADKLALRQGFIDTQPPQS